MIDVAAKLSKSVQLVSRWSIQHGWRDRCAAYDKDQDQQWQQQVAAEKHLVAKRHVRVLQSIQAKGIQALREVNASKLTPRDALAYLMESIRAEGAIYGLGEDADGTPTGGVTVVIDAGMVPGPTSVPTDLVEGGDVP